MTTRSLALVLAPLSMLLSAGCPRDETDDATTIAEGETAESESGSTSDSDSSSSTSDSGSETSSETASESETGVVDPVCGDGVVEGPELCDDGNAIDDDGCSNLCEPRTCEVTWARVDEQKTYSGNSDDPPPITELPDGTLVVAQTVDGATGIDLRVQAWTPAGDPVWEVVHELGNLRDGLGDLIADASGDVYMAAGANVGTDGTAMVLRLSGVDGSEVWRFERANTNVGPDRATALDFDDQGRVLAAMTLAQKEGVQGIILELHALDPATGVSEWTGTWIEPSGAPLVPHSLIYDAERGRVDVALSIQSEQAEPTLVMFEPPSEDPVLVVEVGDQEPDFDRVTGASFDAQGRLWISRVDYPLSNLSSEARVLLHEIDPVEGTILSTIDSAELPIEGQANSAGFRSLSATAEGGLVMSGWTFNTPAGDEHYAYVLALDEQGHNDCVARYQEWSGQFPLESFVASDGAIYVSGIVVSSGDDHSLLLRVR
ncbi:DUF4215 domain-containing protein [Nannocystaceae bacterium ST9]